jgi:hypothetical protein
VVGYRDSSTYRLYDWDEDAIILSSSVDINESPPPPPPTTEESDDEASPTEPDDDDDDDTIRVIPRDTAILDPVPRVVGVEAVGAATKKKKDLNSLPSRAEVPKTRRGRSIKQPIVDPAVLLAQELNRPTQMGPLTLLSLAKQDQALFEDPDIWFRPFRNFKAFLIKPVQQR